MQRIDVPLASGRVVGVLRADEVAQHLQHLIDLLLAAPQRVAADPDSLRVHADQRPHLDATTRAAERRRKAERIDAGTAKRYVLRVELPGGPRIVKINETNTLGNLCLGLFGSVARREHRHQLRAEALGLAASRGVGYLEWRSGIHLRRSAHIQTEMEPRLESIESRLAREVEQEGGVAFERFGVALAATHGVPFFHADLKGFHAYVDRSAEAEPDAGSGEPYRLRWLDLARVSFAMTRRKRVINLYQALRFVIPSTPEAQERFVAAYCRHSGWHADDPARALRSVRDFLRYKLRTHPVVE